MCRAFGKVEEEIAVLTRVDEARIVYRVVNGVKRTYVIIIGVVKDPRVEDFQSKQYGIQREGGQHVVIIPGPLICPHCKERGPSVLKHAKNGYGSCCKTSRASGKDLDTRPARLTALRVAPEAAAYFRPDVQPFE